MPLVRKILLHCLQSRWRWRRKSRRNEPLFTSESKCFINISDENPIYIGFYCCKFLFNIITYFERFSRQSTSWKFTRSSHLAFPVHAGWVWRQFRTSSSQPWSWPPLQHRHPDKNKNEVGSKGVNFTNILRAGFWYKRFAQSFFVLIF